MKFLFVLIGIFFLSNISSAQGIQSCGSETLMQRIKQNQDTLYVINFWATWCGPCVRELPEFNLLEKHYNAQPVKVLLVSLDFQEAYPQKLISFIKRKKITPEVIWLNETNANEFIPKIEPRWQGSIPATLILYEKKQYRNFFEGTVTARQIRMLIDRQLSF